MTATAYPVAHKQKSFDLCLAFVRGCGGQIGTTLRDGPAVFFGVDRSNVDIWREVVRSGRDFYYLDNAFLDPTRQSHFRVAKNRLQHSGLGTSTGERFKALGIELQPWKQGGKHIVLCPQSAHFMEMVIGGGRDWVEQTLDALKHLTELPVKVRPWSADKAKVAATLQEDLKDAAALVTWSSAAAISAVIAGVPIVTLGQCAAEPMAGALQDINRLPRPDRTQWASVLADHQFTRSELSDGTAWRTLNAD